MPPKIQVTEQQIIETAIQLVEEKGIRSLHVRNLCNRLSCTARPIFRAYGSMEGLKEELIKSIDEIYMEYLRRPYSSDFPFLQLGMNHIAFAKERRHLFAFLFLSGAIHAKTFSELIGGGKQGFVQQVADMLQVEYEKAQVLYLDLCMLSHGIATMIATNDTGFSQTEIEKMLIIAFQGITYQIKQSE